MRKNKLVYFLVLTALMTIGVPSCDSPDYAAIRGIANIKTLDLSTNAFLQDPGTTTSDSIALFVTMNIQLFSGVHFRGSLAEAWAFQQPDPEMANEITDIRVFCNKSIYGIPAGQNLSPELLFGEEYISRLPLEGLLEFLPKKGDEYFDTFEITIFLNSKPLPDIYLFTVEVEDNNSHIFTGMTQVEWL